MRPFKDVHLYLGFEKATTKKAFHCAYTCIQAQIGKLKNLSHGLKQKSVLIWQTKCAFLNQTRTFAIRESALPSGETKRNQSAIKRPSEIKREASRDIKTEINGNQKEKRSEGNATYQQIKSGINFCKEQKTWCCKTEMYFVGPCNNRQIRKC